MLAEDAGKDLVEVLGELDEDLARQEAAIRERRERLRVLLQTEGSLPAEGPVSPQLAALFQDMAQVSDSPMAAKDREMLTLLETVAPEGEARDRLMNTMRHMAETPGATERAHELYARLDALVDAAPDDPRVAEAARFLAVTLPDEVAAGLGDEDIVPGDNVLAAAFFADLAPAQEAVVLQALRLVRERAR